MQKTLKKDSEQLETAEADLDVDADSEALELEQEVERLQQELAQATQAQLRSQADYQNLVRRTQQEKARFIQIATKEFAENLLQPLDHLGRAAEQLNDKGLTMVIAQLWKSLNDQGLEEIEVMGKQFDDLTMEVVEKKGEHDTVTSIVKKGYRLNGDVIQHAKVIVE